MEKILDVEKLVGSAREVISYGNLEVTGTTMMEVQKITLDSGKVLTLAVILGEPSDIIKQYPFAFPLQV